MLSDSLIESYLEQCDRVRRLDAKTVRAYRCDLGQYLEWSAGGSADPLSRESVRAYLAHLNGRYAPASAKRKLAALRAFMSWAVEEGRIGRSPFDGLKLRAREPKRLPRTIALADLGLLFRGLYAGAGGPAGFPFARDRAIVEVLIAIGVRVSELCALDVGDVDMEGRAARIAGKGGKERMVQLEDAHTLAALGEYLALRGGPAAPDERALFVNRLGTRMSDRAVREVVDPLQSRVQGRRSRRRARPGAVRRHRPDNPHRGR